MGTFEKREKNGVTWLSATPFEKMEGIVQGFSNAAWRSEHRVSVEHEPEFFAWRSGRKCT